MRKSKVSIMSGLSKSKDKNSPQKKHQIDQVSSINYNKSFISLTEKLPSQEDKLIRKLLNLQVTLINKINDLKFEKISVLQEYNKEYDKFTKLSLEINRLQNSQTSQKHENNSNISIKINLREQEKLRKTLQQFYEINQQNNVEQQKLNADQLQELTKLIKLHTKSYHKKIYQQIQNKNLCDNDDLSLTSYKFQEQITKLQMQISENTTISESILILKQAISNYLPKRLSFLQSHQKLIKNFQKESRSNVESLTKRKSEIQKQVEYQNQFLKEYELRYQMHKSRQQIMLNENSNPDWVKKYEKMMTYRQLKQQYKKLQEIAKNKDKFPSNFDLGRNMKQRQKNQKIKQCRQTQIEIQRLQQKVKRYEEYLKNENQNKIQLFNEIKQKQQEFNQIKSQNKVMSQLEKLIK